jgi:hypothetical protein
MCGGCIDDKHCKSCALRIFRDIVEKRLMFIRHKNVVSQLYVLPEFQSNKVQHDKSDAVD